MREADDSAEALTAQAIALADAGSFDAAIPFLERAAGADSRAEHWANLAVGYARAGRDEHAVAAFQAALQRAPNDPVLREDAQAFFRRRHDTKRGEQTPVSKTGPRPDTDIAHLRDLASAFERKLSQRKAEVRPPAFWYPFGTLSNFVHLERLLRGNHRQLLRLAGDRGILDIGAADGDLAFFMESLGVPGTIVDYGPTNFNGLQGARLLREHLESHVEIHEVDLDDQFRLPGTTYGLVFFLGILYHLKNPYFALEALAKTTRYLLLSTRTTLFSADQRVRLAEVPVAYLLDAEESFNRDASNYWIFSECGLGRILTRTGWEVRDHLTVGNMTTADPASREGDMRTFVLAESRRTR